MFKPFSAEFFGTFWLVLGGCGSALISAAFPQLGIGFLGVALAFGLTVVTICPERQKNALLRALRHWRLVW
ncbi:putative aquaporin [Shigella sonnei]|nr:putative aquaporin [Shigella sonnei]